MKPSEDWKDKLLANLNKEGTFNDKGEAKIVRGDKKFPVALENVAIPAEMVHIKFTKIHNRPVKESFYYILTRYLAFYSLFRIFIEFLRGDKIRGIYYGFSTSQLASFSILFFLLILKLKRLNPRN